MVPPSLESNQAKWRKRDKVVVFNMEDVLYAVVCIIAVIQSVLAIFMISCLVFRLKKSNRVCVLVIGDIGRSPRMQNHAVSLAESGHVVDLVGLPGK